MNLPENIEQKKEEKMLAIIKTILILIFLFFYIVIAVGVGVKLGLKSLLNLELDSLRFLIVIPAFLSSVLIIYLET